MARSAAADGIRVLAATPHVRDDYPTTPEGMERALEALRDALRSEAIELDVVPGGELALEHAARLGADELRRFGLGGNDRWLLVEFPYSGWRASRSGWPATASGSCWRTRSATPTCRRCPAACRSSSATGCSCS